MWEIRRLFMSILRIHKRQKFIIRQFRRWEKVTTCPTVRSTKGMERPGISVDPAKKVINMNQHVTLSSNQASSESV